MKVVWSEKAKEEVGKIKLYLIDNWSEKVADNFIKEVGEKNRNTQAISRYRKSFPYRTVRKKDINSQTSGFVLSGKEK